MKTISKKCIALMLILFFCSSTFANNIKITNVIVLPNTNQIQFDVSWDNSWRSDVLQNWDAAYIFMKYKDEIGIWKPLVFSLSNNIVPTGYTILIPPVNFNMATYYSGAFLYRSAAGSGISNISGVKIGIPANLAAGVFDIKVFGVEMVYIPTGSYFLGDKNGSTNSFHNNFGPDRSYYVENNYLVDMKDPIIPAQIFSADNLPNGYDNFYCMKYEISQGAYRDFLNTLGYGGQINRTANLPNSGIGTKALTNSNIGRSYIEVATPGNAATNTPAVYGCDAFNNNIFDEINDGEYVVCNYLNWPDLAAYLAWAGLAPMTELQFEKTCRGPVQPLGGEYAWGNTLIASTPYNILNSSYDNEVVSNASSTIGNANYNATSTGNVPFRNGIFATATSNRITSGGSYYGVMEMSGSVWERVITTANTEGRNYTGKVSGLFIYPNSGNAAVDLFIYWPGNHAGQIDGTVPALGLMYRGGSNSFPATELRVSNRTAAYVITLPDVVRYIDQGGRGVRNLQ
jgi:formylglycine-generating enzyme required for sulfatase activity